MPRAKRPDDQSLQARLKLSSKNFDQHRMQAFDTAEKHLVDDLERLRPEGEDFVKTFVANHKVPRRQIQAHLDFQSTLGPISDLLRNGRLDFQTIVTLVELGQAARDEVVRFIKTGHPTDASEAMRIAADWRDRRKSDDEAVYKDAMRSLRDDQLRRMRKDAVAFRRAASLLHMALTAYEDLSSERRPDARDAITRLSKDLYARFNEAAPGKAVPVEEWGAIASKADRKLAEVEHALMKLSTGDFQDQLPSIVPSEDFPYPYNFKATGMPDWSALDSVRFLARKSLSAVGSSRYASRPVTKLWAVDISAGIGAKALGLKSAGFYISKLLEADARSGAIAKRNRPRWPVEQCATADFKAIRGALEPVVKSRKGTPLDLIVGGYIPKLLQSEGTEEDSSSADTAFTETIEFYKPRSFFIEVHADVLKDGQIDLYQTMTMRLARQGYHLDVFEMYFPDYGIPQDRTSLYLVGIKSEFRDRLRRPIIRKRKTISASRLIADIAFPHRMKPSSTTAKPTAAQRKYDDWSNEWLENGPTLVGDLRGAWSTANKRVWAAYRFDLAIKSDTAVRIGKLPEHSLIPLTTQIIKRLQGLPDGWKIPDPYANKKESISVREQRKLLCAETPPVITLAVARSVHAALTGENVDLDSEGALSISSSDFMFHPLNPYDVPKPREWEAAIWRSGVRAMLGKVPTNLAPEDCVSEDEDDQFDPSELPDFPLGDQPRVRFKVHGSNRVLRRKPSKR